MSTARIREVSHPFSGYDFAGKCCCGIKILENKDNKYTNSVLKHIKVSFYPSVGSDPNVDPKLLCLRFSFGHKLYNPSEVFFETVTEESLSVLFSLDDGIKIDDSTFVDLYFVSPYKNGNIFMGNTDDGAPTRRIKSIIFYIIEY